MKVVCTYCKKLHEIHGIEESFCPDCNEIMSPFEKDLLQVTAASYVKQDETEKTMEEGLGL
jgi:hypothetical protein